MNNLNNIPGEIIKTSALPENVPTHLIGVIMGTSPQTVKYSTQALAYSVSQLMTNVVKTDEFYADPSWITALSWDKLTNVPSFSTSLNANLNFLENSFAVKSTDFKIPVPKSLSNILTKAPIPLPTCFNANDKNWIIAFHAYLKMFNNDSPNLPQSPLITLVTKLNASAKIIPAIFTKSNKLSQIV